MIAAGAAERIGGLGGGLPYQSAPPRQPRSSIAPPTAGDKEAEGKMGDKEQLSRRR